MGVRERAAEAVGTAEQETRSRVELGRGELAGHVGAIGRALGDASRGLRDNDETTAAELAERLGRGVERLSEYLEKRDSGEVLRDAGRFARSNPALFLGGAALLGFSVARFLRSSQPAGLNVGRSGIGGMRVQGEPSRGSVAEESDPVTERRPWTHRSVREGERR